MTDIERIANALEALVAIERKRDEKYEALTEQFMPLIGKMVADASEAMNAMTGNDKPATVLSIVPKSE